MRLIRPSPNFIRETTYTDKQDISIENLSNSGMCAMFPMSVWLCVYSVLMLWLDLNCWIDILSGSSNHMPSALSLRMNNLVSKLFGLCYDSWIASLSPHLSPCLDMVFVHCLLPAFWKQLANSLAMFYSRLKDQALLRIHLSFYST